MSQLLAYFNLIQTIKGQKEYEKYLIDLFKNIPFEKNFSILCDYHAFFRKEQFDSIKKISAVIEKLIGTDKITKEDLTKKTKKVFEKTIKELSKKLTKNDNNTFETKIKLFKEEVKLHHVIIALLSLNIFYRDDLREIFNKSINNSFLVTKTFFNGLTNIKGIGFFFDKTGKMGFNQKDTLYFGYEFVINQLEVIIKDSFIPKMINYEVLSHEFSHSIKFDFTKKIETLDNKVTNLCEIILMDTIFYKKKTLYKLIKQATKENDFNSSKKITKNAKDNEALKKEISQLRLNLTDEEFLIKLPGEIALLQEKINYFKEVFHEWPAILISFLFVYFKAVASTNDNFKSFFLCNKNEPLTKAYQNFIKRFNSENYRAYANTNLELINWLSKNPNQPLNELMKKINDSLTNEVLSKEFTQIIDKTIKIMIDNNLIKSITNDEYQKQVLPFIESFKKQLP